MSTATKITTTCSGCSTDLRIELHPSGQSGKVTSHIPSNAVRGSRHVPAHDLDAEVWRDDRALLLWECPACGYADSYDESFYEGE